MNLKTISSLMLLLIGSIGAISAHALIVNIQPITICMDDGTGCADNGFFEAATDKIWSQAGIDMNFLSMETIDNTDWLDVTGITNTLGTEAQAVMEFGRDNNNDSNVTLAINMFFVDALNSSTSFYGLGCGGAVYAAYCDGTDPGAGLVGVFIAGAVYDFALGLGRLDTIAHEIGHVLGLTHDDFGAGAADNLMTSGGSRTAPTDINDITPDGALLSKLTAEQIAEATDSKFVQVPEPSTLGLLLAGLVMLGRRKNRLTA